MGLRDFQQLQGHLQHLEFKVWEHPNLKVSTLTLKEQFFDKLVLFLLLRSKKPTTNHLCSLVSDQGRNSLIRLLFGGL